MLKPTLLPSYCYHCGKPLKTEEKYFCKGLRININIHGKCFLERKKIEYRLRKERYKIIMSDPEIRKRILKIDKKLIKKRSELKFK